MKSTLASFKDSSREFTHVTTLTTCAVLGALQIILGFFSIQIGSFLKIGFTTLPQYLASYLFGPAVAPFYGMAMDIINYLLKPTGPFFPGFTLVAAVSCLIMGIGLYRKPLTLKRVFIVMFINQAVCNIFLNTLFLTILYGQGFFAILPMRIVKNLIQWPINTLMLYALIEALERAHAFSFLKRPA